MEKYAPSSISKRAGAIAATRSRNGPGANSALMAAGAQQLQPIIIGMPFIVITQQQPMSIIQFMVSHMACIHFIMLASPVVTMQHMSFLSMAMFIMPIMPGMQVIMGMPFIVMQQAIMAPCIMGIICCIIGAMVESTGVQRMHMPLSVFSIFIVHFIIIGMFIMPGIMPIVPGIIGAFIIWPMLPIWPMFIMPIGLAIIGISIIFIMAVAPYWLWRWERGENFRPGRAGPALLW